MRVLAAILVTGPAARDECMYNHLTGSVTAGLGTVTISIFCLPCQAAASMDSPLGEGLSLTLAFAIRPLNDVILLLDGF